MCDSMEIQDTEYLFLHLCRKYTIKKKKQTQPNPNILKPNRTKKPSTTNEQANSLLALGEFSW